MDIQVGDRVTIDCMGDVKTIVITREQQIEQIKDNVASYTNKILKIERPKYEVVEEKKELLTEEEREFLKQYIKMSPINITYITKEFNNNKSIIIKLNDGQGTAFCTYYTTDYFKALEEDEIYTLKELGLEEN